jgi:hypothetical protein
VEARLYEIWQEKLETILLEFGVDKTGDVLDSSDASAQFERLARTALLNPDALNDEVDLVVMDIRKAAAKASQLHSLYTSPVEERDRVPSVPLHAWVRTMAGEVAAPDAMQGEQIDLSAQVIERINALTPFFAVGKPIPRLKLEGLGFPLDGWFSLWKVGIAEGIWRQQNVFALFNTPEGKSFSKSAQRVWDELAANQVTITVEGETDEYDLDKIQEQAERESIELYNSVVRKAQTRAKHRIFALETSYLARKSSLARIGLDAVRESRRRELETEYATRRAEINLVTQALPEITCLFLARIVAE